MQNFAGGKIGSSVEMLLRKSTIELNFWPQINVTLRANPINQFDVLYEIMNFKLPYIFSVLILLCLSANAFAVVAPSNDRCSKAYTIRNVESWCSSPRQFTTDGATASGLENPGCFPSFLLEPDNDVWFKFTARATTVNISVIGAIAGSPKGTLQYPQFALYQGKCSGNMREVACMSDGRGFNIAETFVSSLVVGETYYIRVDGRNGKTGSFQLCVNNFNPVPSPASDCSSAVVLCDKSSFTVPSVTGAGRNRRELPSGICLQEESSSAWYKWTCDKPGTLTFTLTPVNPGDDLDFAVFQLPFGVDDCAVKTPYRCMASGEDVGASFSMWAKCSGATGLRNTASDIVEQPGCQEGNDNFLAALKMEAGVSYALLVNNYHNTGNGFSIEFGGTGTFKGPKAHFTVSKLKISQDQNLWVKNASSFEGGIKSWEYNFGIDASPQTARSAGPHKVKYSSAGKKSISLTIETNNGCKVTKVRTITVTAPPPPPPPGPEPEPEVAEPERVTPEEPIVETPKGPSQPPPTVENIEPETPAEAVGEAAPEPIPAPDPEEKEPELVTYNVKYTATIYFPSDSFSLDSDDFEILNEVLRLLQENPERTAIVEGHTNNIPSDDYCDKLATNRANSVITWLQSRGISEDRIVRKIYGKDKVYGKVKKFSNRRIYQKAVVKLVQTE